MFREVIADARSENSPDIVGIDGRTLEGGRRCLAGHRNVVFVARWNSAFTPSATTVLGRYFASGDPIQRYVPRCGINSDHWYQLQLIFPWYYDS